MTILLFGQPGSGKTTIAKLMADILRSVGLSVVHVDGDVFREMTGNSDYSRTGRENNMEKVYLTLASLDGVFDVVIGSVVAPYAQARSHFIIDNAVYAILLQTTRDVKLARHVAEFKIGDIEDLCGIVTTDCEVGEAVARCFSVLLEDVRDLESDAFLALWRSIISNLGADAKNPE